jgi:hypothetical protein
MIICLITLTKFTIAGLTLFKKAGSINFNLYIFVN